MSGFLNSLRNLASGASGTSAGGSTEHRGEWPPSASILINLQRELTHFCRDVNRYETLYQYRRRPSLSNCFICLEKCITPAAN